MAQIYMWDRQGFEQAYWRYFYKLKGCGASAPRSCRCHDSYITYSRDFFETNSMFTERATKVIKALNLPEGSKVLVVGCALGYLMEEFEKLKMQPYGFDNSNYIKGVKNKEKVKFDIPSIDILSNTFAADVKQAFRMQLFDCVVTEDVLPSHDSYSKIFQNCESVLSSSQPKTHVVHIVQVDALPPLTQKTLQEWSQTNPQHTWLNQNGDKV